MKNRNSPVVFEGFIFIIPLLVLTVIFACYGLVWSTAGFLVATLFVTNFFRNPERTAPGDERAIVSPADGRVIKIEEVAENDFLKDSVKKVSIFMNLFNVHVNRAPCSGLVKIIRYKEGKFFSANLDKASLFNERNYVLVQTEGGKEILTIQIAGIIARRIVCWVKEGMRIEKGERFGLIRFGSRLEVFMPVDTEILVKIGDKVKAGETEIGCLK